MLVSIILGCAKAKNIITKIKREEEAGQKAELKLNDLAIKKNK
jgi:hypothetical protein